jgi:hypothetical protein
MDIDSGYQGFSGAKVVAEVTFAAQASAHEQPQNQDQARLSLEHKHKLVTLS